MNAMSNYVQLIGNVGREVEFKDLGNGRAMARVSIATREVHTHGDDGQRHVEVQWHQIIGWGRVAELMQVLLHKGSSVLIHGKLKHQFLGEGDKRQLRTEVVVSEFRLIK